MRKPFQGIYNILRFNWPFYAFSVGLALIIFYIRYFSNGALTTASNLMLVLIIVPTLISLIVSFHVYDLSGFYKLNWLDGLLHEKGETIVNINAGFDETSSLLEMKFENSKLIVFDFYDPAKHTEASIKRARKAYPPFPGTLKITTSNIPLKDNFADKIFVLSSAHEIRDHRERKTFFIELNRILMPNGRIVIVEHLRDTANFLAYNIGVFHFHSRRTWLDTFAAAGLNIETETNITPFMTAFFLKKNGTKS